MYILLFVCVAFIILAAVCKVRYAQMFKCKHCGNPNLILRTDLMINEIGIYECPECNTFMTEI